ncbi:hypothetical protein ACS0TY_005328 [Phlomoides rotata]
MERPIALKPLSIRDENSTIHRKKATADSKSKTSKQGAKNGGFSLKSRKALNDITNKSSIHTEASSQKKKSDNKKCNIVGDGHSHHHAFEGEPRLKKKVSANEKPDIAEEGFLHDHNKCIDAHKAALEISFYDTVFPGHGNLFRFIMSWFYVVMALFLCMVEFHNLNSRIFNVLFHLSCPR